MSLPTSLDHCVIHVSDWEVALDFYTRVLGAEAVAAPGGGYVFRFGEQQLNCHGPDKVAEPKAADPVRPGNSDLCFRWDGPIDAAIRHLEAEGVSVDTASDVQLSKAFMIIQRLVSYSNTILFST